MERDQNEAGRNSRVVTAISGGLGILGIAMTVAVAHDLAYLLGRYLDGEEHGALVLCGIAAIMLLRRIMPREAAQAA